MIHALRILRGSSILILLCLSINIVLRCLGFDTDTVPMAASGITFLFLALKHDYLLPNSYDGNEDTDLNITLFVLLLFPLFFSHY